MEQPNTGIQDAQGCTFLVTESQEECGQVGGSVSGQESTRVLLQCSEVPLASSLRGEAAISLIGAPLAHCTTVEAVPLAAVPFKACKETRICPGEL